MVFINLNHDELVKSQKSSVFVTPPERGNPGKLGIY